MKLSKEQIDLLPLHPARCPPGSSPGKTLSHVEAYDIKATLIRVFGFSGFSAEVIESKILDIRGEADGRLPRVGTERAREGSVIARSTVRLSIFGIGPDGERRLHRDCHWVVSGSDIGETADNAIKTAASDALKRCAIYLGDQFGLSLYKKAQE